MRRTSANEARDRVRGREYDDRPAHGTATGWRRSENGDPGDIVPDDSSNTVKSLFVRHVRCRGGEREMNHWMKQK